MKKKQGTNADPKLSAVWKGNPKSKSVQQPVHEIIDECPKQTKDCENCELIYCPEERIE